MTEKRLLAPRRLALACALVALTALPLATVALGGKDASAKPFPLPAVHAGDFVQYARDGDMVHLTNFTVDARDLLPDGNGTFHVVRPVRMDTPMGFSFNFPMQPSLLPGVLPGSGCAVNMTSHVAVLFLWDDANRAGFAAGSGAGGMSSVCSGNPVTGYHTDRVTSTRQALSFDNRATPCGIIQSLQGATSYAPMSTCGLDFQADSAQSERTGTMVLHASTVAKDRQGRDVEVGIDLHFQPGNPYPVRIVTTLDGQPRNQEVLVGFSRGDDDPAAPALPPPRHLPDVALIPWDAFGPTQQPDFPIRLRDAFTAARNDSGFPDLRDWIAAHPGWTMNWARNQREGTSYGWIFQVQTQDSGLFVFTTFTPATTPDVPALPPIVPGEPTPRILSHSSFSSMPGQGGTTRLPAQGPDPGSALARWHAWTAKPTGPDTWGFFVSCGDTCLVILEAGDEWNDPGTSSPAGTTNMSALRIDGAGRTEGFVTAVATVTHEDGASYAPGPPRPARQQAIRALLPAGAAASVGGIGLFAALGYLFWPALRGLPLFSRVAADELATHPARRRILDAVEAQPGIHYQALVRMTGLAKGTVEHHVRKLVRAGLLTARRAQGYSCYFPAGTPRQALEAAGAAKAPGAQRILAAVAQRPGASSQEVAAAAAVDATTVTHHVQRLSQAGLIEARREGRFVRLYPTRA